VIDSARFDVGLIESLAHKQPDWSFALLGPVRQGMNLTPLKALPNVHVMGNRVRESLPGYLKGFDAAIVPYALNDATRGIYPMKLQEYLAGGKPVVCPPLPECLHLNGVVRFAGRPEEFEKAIVAALADQSPESIASRLEVAQANGWEQRMIMREAHVVRMLTRPELISHHPLAAPGTHQPG
jgi:glycosyltransferase involved in cell wall biosynthesis